MIPLGNPGQAGPVAWGRAGDHVGWAVGFSGNRLVAGAPDQGASGAVTLLGRNDATGIRLAPGAGQVPAVDGGGPADFGAAVG